MLENVQIKGYKSLKNLDLELKNLNILIGANGSGKSNRLKQRWNIEDNRYLREDAANLAPFLLKLREKSPDSYGRIVETIRLIAPFFGDFILEPVNDNVLLQWREPGSDLIFNAAQASDGTLRTMALITLLLQPKSELSDVIILDEPELGLHPYAINILAGLLQSVCEHCK